MHFNQEVSIFKHLFAFIHGKGKRIADPTGIYHDLQIPGSGKGPDVNGMFMAFQRLKAAEVSLSTCLDIGASDGRWTERFLASFPGCKSHLFEAKKIHTPALQKLAASDKRVSFIQAAASKEAGKIRFYNPPGRPFGGRASFCDSSNWGTFSKDVEEVDATSIDNEVKNKKLTGPFLIKVDTHGHELAILEGAEETLKETNCLILELYNLQIGPDALLFWEMCAWLSEKGFRCWDIFDLVRRESDQILWQMDAVFLPASHPAFSRVSS
jgi:FkbM family methyltransferase